MVPIPLPLRTVYADLLQKCQAEDLRAGSVLTQVHSGRAYLKAMVSVGATRVTCHLGPADDPAAQALAEAHRAAMRRAERRRELVVHARRVFGQPDRKIARIVDALEFAGLFRQGALLVGSTAFQLYGAVLGERLAAAAGSTEDVDVATPDLKLVIAPQANTHSFVGVLHLADPTFTAVPGLKAAAFPWHFRDADGFFVDLLTPTRSRRHDPARPVPGRAASAMALSQLDWLIADPLRAVVLHKSGVLVNVPDPARFAVHKLIVSQKPGREPNKARKDLEQARALCDVLGDRFGDALADASGRGRKGWAEPLARALQRLDTSAG